MGTGWWLRSVCDELLFPACFPLSKKVRTQNDGRCLLADSLLQDALDLFLLEKNC
jgi:hypothetical protein